MGKNTLGQKLEKRKVAFLEAFASDSYTEEQNGVFRNAINSVDYIKLCYKGDVVLPGLDMDAESPWGMVYEWLGGSYRNIELAEDILKGCEIVSSDADVVSVEKAVQEAVEVAIGQYNQALIDVLNEES